MAKLSSRQVAWRGRIEAGLRVAAPLLDVVLAAGERLSKSVDRDELAAEPPPRAVTPMAAQRRVGPGR